MGHSTVRVWICAWKSATSLLKSRFPSYFKVIKSAIQLSPAQFDSCLLQGETFKLLAFFPPLLQRFWRHVIRRSRHPHHATSLRNHSSSSCVGKHVEYHFLNWMCSSGGGRGSENKLLNRDYAGSQREYCAIPAVDFLRLFRQNWWLSLLVGWVRIPESWGAMQLLPVSALNEEKNCKRW